ncbi:polysaccharide lyase 8 family protein [Streptomyces lunaelactis]|nr:polysaccharide lyase 8 family protein [Streptomyces lunaelactis]NUK14604.1 polysaccharide lyase 8 family protein [Streptomyces lunaelactis]NUK50284.1 polysaccharide lyase 8 family protein [Streptomyces lunaelactis]NUK72408.1 polysaccharide lyase 8 family protein [Streptomyces lunaelactis]NUK75971.1 polysaccharide lyase 8 family protein [Streptomyces lunaelactis]
MPIEAAPTACYTNGQPVYTTSVPEAPVPHVPAWSRRTFLAATGASALALTLASPGHAAAADEFETLRLRWVEISLGAGYDPTAEPYASRLAETGKLAAEFRASMAPTDTSLWPGHTFDPPAGITQSYNRLWTMTQAYAQEGTGLTGDAGLLAGILRGLDHLAATIYNPSTTRYGNWWEWQIGSPRLLMDIVAALHGRLTAAQRDAAFAAVDHFVPDSVLGSYSGTSTGANRVDLCRSVALRGVLGKAPAKIALARDALSPVFPYVTKGDGLYADGSFVQHTWVAYSGTYGQVMLDGLGRLFALLAGSTWAVTDPNRQIILDSVERAYAPLIFNGLMMDSVNGRAISRGYLKSDDRRIMRSDHFHGQGLIAAIALLAGGASAAERDRWHARIKGWIERDTTTPILAGGQFGVADLSRLHAVAAAPVPAAPEPVGHQLFASMDRAVHRRPGWAANISMASERISYYECGNGENPRGWHTGAGMLYWWPGEDHGDQYTDWFWPTVDYYRLPGTTVSTKRLADRAGGEWGVPKPAVKWVGGASDGEFAAVGQHLLGLGSTLRARKSWFCAADAVICLGAGITSTDGAPVETIVDNRNLGADGTNALTVGRGWAHLEGHGGWVFPGGTERLRTLREERGGAWSDINTTSSTERVTRRYQTLWLDHGTDPADASYAYLLMPGASRRTLAARARDERRLEILANTEACQAVAVRSLGLTAANFWQPGTVGPLTATAPTSALVRSNRRTASLHISEPPRTGAPLEITWHHPVREVTSKDASIEVLATGRSLRLRITGSAAGATQHCEVALR